MAKKILGALGLAGKKGAEAPAAAEKSGPILTRLEKGPLDRRNRRDRMARPVDSILSDTLGG